MVLTVFSLSLILVGGILLAVGMLNDYTEFTGRAEATVVERVVERDTNEVGDSRGVDSGDIEVYVAYEVDGQEYPHTKLNGINPNQYHEGDTLTVAFHPEEPDRAVTTPSTEPGAMDVFVYVGAGLLALAVVVLGAGAVWFVRTRRW